MWHPAPQSKHPTVISRIAATCRLADLPTWLAATCRLVFITHVFYQKHISEVLANPSALHYMAISPMTPCISKACVIDDSMKELSSITYFSWWLKGKHGVRCESSDPLPTMSQGGPLPFSQRLALW